MGYLISKHDDPKAFIMKPVLTCPQSMVIMAMEKTGKSNLFANVIKMLVAQFDLNAYKTATFNVSNMTMYKELEAKFIADRKISTKPIKHIINKEANVGYFVPPSIMDLAREVNPYMKPYKEAMKKLNEYIWDKDQLEYDKQIDSIRRIISDMPAPIVVIDNLTSLMTEVYIAALANYEDKFPKTKGENYSIKTVDTYGGAQYIRLALQNIYQFIQTNIAPIIVYLGHVKPKLIRKDTDDLTASDLDMEGKVGDIFTRQVEAVGILSRRDNEGLFLDFTKRDDDLSIGSRVANLNGKVIKIADWANEGEDPVNVKKYFDVIFPDIYNS